MVATGLDLLHTSGESRPHASRRTNVVMTVLSTWFVLGLFVDAYAHANLSQLETFFTPWHALFYSGFAATSGWVLWTIWRQVQQGRRGIAAVPLGYGATVVALPVFAVAGAADAVWHTVLGIETSTDIFFSPSHLGLFAAMVVILTSPLRSAWDDPDLGPRPSLRALLPAVLGLALTTSLVLLFLTYGNALLFFGDSVVTLLSTLDEGGAEMLAARIVVTDIVLLAPLLLLARRWQLPPGAATITYVVAATVSGALTGFENVGTLLSVVAAGAAVDVLARLLRPTADRRAAFVAFAAAGPLLTWSLYLAVASAEAGRLPAVTELWTGIPLVAALIGALLALLMVPARAPVAGSQARLVDQRRQAEIHEGQD